MTKSGTLVPAGEVLAEIETLLDRFDPDRSGLDPNSRLTLVRQARKVSSRVEALKAVVTAEADQADAAQTAAGTRLVSWLGMGETVSRREAAGAVRQARRLAQHPLLGQAAIAGKLGTSQARAISGVLDSLANQLDDAQQSQAEQLLVDLAGHLDADQLSKAAGQVLAQVAPESADELLERRLQREAEAAYRQRSLRFFRDGGSVRFDGSLPRVEAETWITQIEACAEQQRRNAIETKDRLATSRTPEQRRADALITLIHTGAGTGGDTARVLVKLDYHQLHTAAAGAGLIGEDQPLSAGELRRICCDAELIPIVLGTESEVLDVGRAQRLVTPALRAALIARDGGCTFPGCDAPPARCEAHHIIPWHLGGPTELSNLVLQCHSDHPRVEPARYGVRDQWQVRIADGLPEHLPPKRLDPNQQPIRHQRHQPKTGYQEDPGQPGTRPAEQPGARSAEGPGTGPGAGTGPSAQDSDPRAGPPTAA